MLLTKKVEVKVYSKNINYYKNLGYSNLHNNDTINIDIDYLSKGSHIIVDVKCDICGKEKQLKYNKFNENIKRDGYYSCSKKCGNLKREKTNLKKYGDKFISNVYEVRNKIKITNIEKYGVENPFQSEKIKNKIKKTSFEKYGYSSVMKNRDVINKGLNKKIDSKIIYNISKDGEFIFYRNKVRNLTKTKKKQLLEAWDGYDHYDGEYIKDYYYLNSNNPLYPTIDHKISISYGYINNIPIEEIGNLDNLCITKRKINSSKCNKVEKDFKF